MERRRPDARRAAARPAPPSRSGRIRRSSSPRAPSSSPAPCSSGCRRWRSSTGASRSSSTTSAPRRSRRSRYQYKGGIVDFVKHLNASKEALFSKVCHYEDDDEDGQTLDIAIQWNTGYYEGIHGYANGISTTEGGMHVEGFQHRAHDGASTSTPGPRTCSRRRTRTSSARTSARASRRSSRSSCATRSSRARPRPSSATSRCARSCRRPPTSGWPSGSRRTRPRPTRSSRRRRPRRRPASRPRTPATPSAARRRCRGAGMPDKLKDCSSRNAARERAVHRRGRLGRRHRGRRPRPAHPGDPADPRQDPQRRAGPPRQDAEEQRGPGADHGHRRRRRRGVRRRQGPLPQGHRAWPTPTSTAATSARCC